MGFVSPVAAVLDAFGIEKDARGNARASTDEGGYATNVPGVFAAGTSAGANRWWCGRSGKADKLLGRWTSSDGIERTATLMRSQPSRSPGGRNERGTARAA